MVRFSLLVLSVAILALTNTGCDSSQPEANASSPSSSEAAQKIALISITSDPNTDLQEVNMGLTFAGFCVDEGYDVNIFLNVKGVHLATNDFSDEIAFLSHSPLKEQLKALNGRGVQVHVCPVCMGDFEIEADEIIEEAFVTDKPKLFGKLGSDTIVFTY